MVALLIVTVLGTVGCTIVEPGWDPCNTNEGDPACLVEEPDTTTTTPLVVDCKSTGGTCVEEAPGGFFGPNLYRVGFMNEKASCSDIGLRPGETLYKDLGLLTHACPVCACGPSETTCVPSPTWTVAAGKCSDAEDAQKTPFDVLAESWTGDCNNDNTIAADLLCEGAEPCAQSVTVKAPDAIGSPCTAEATGKEEKQGPPWPWDRVAHECLMTPSDTCLDAEGQAVEGQVCVPVPGEGEWMACVSFDHHGHDEPIECPTFYNDEVHEMFKDVDDSRACTACTCGDPEGGECAVQASAYGDAACSDFMVGGVIFSGDGQACFDVSSGVALGSKAAAVKLTTPGGCLPAGGDATGTVAPAHRVTLCCHREDAP